MRTYLVWEERDPDPIEVEADDAHEACEKVAATNWDGSAGECGQEMTFFCEGEVYHVTVEFEPTFTAWGSRQKEHPGPRPEHECKRGQEGKICFPCIDYERALKDWVKHQELVKAFHDAAKEHGEEVGDVSKEAWALVEKLSDLEAWDENAVYLGGSEGDWNASEEGER